LLFLICPLYYRAPPAVHSFPTRRSSDLDALGSTIAILDQTADVAAGRYRHEFGDDASVGVVATVRHGQDYHNGVVGVDGRWAHRSEEHTSELQSREKLVCRLLLEKKKQS